MKKLAALVALVAFAAGLPLVLAETGGRIVEIEGDVTFADGHAAAAGVDIQDGTTLAARPGARARISIPGVGEITLVGPASVRVGHTGGVPSVTVLGGSVSFAYQGKSVRLAVEDGTLELSRVTGRTATLARGADVLIEGNGSDPKVIVKAGSALFSGGSEHVLVRAGETREFGAPQSGADSVTLSGRDVELQLPTEVLLEDGHESSSALDELESAWDSDRESPRVP